MNGMLLWPKVAVVVKDPPVNAGDLRDQGSIPALGRFHGGGHCNPLLYSCLKNTMDRGTWQAIAGRVTKSETQQKWLGMHAWHFLPLTRHMKGFFFLPKFMCRIWLGASFLFTALSWCGLHHTYRIYFVLQGLIAWGNGIVFRLYRVLTIRHKEIHFPFGSSFLNM